MSSVDLSWVDSLKEKWGAKILTLRESAPGEMEFTVARADAIDFISALKNLPGGEFNHLADLTGYDESKQSPRFHAVYELISMNRKLRCAVIVPCPDDAKPSVPSVAHLWAGAVWLERETYDLLGIEFEGNPDLRRILLPPSFVGHPLRKDFVFDYRQEFAEAVAENETFDPFGSNIVNVPQTES